VKPKAIDKRRLRREFYSTREVARIFGRHIRTIRRWIDEGKIEVVQPHPHAHYLIPRAEIIRKIEMWLE